VTKQTRLIVIAVAAVALGIFFFIVAKWLLLVLLGGLVLGWIVFATESAKAQTAPAHPPVPVYTPPVQPAAAVPPEPASYAQGYQAQSSQKSAIPGFPFGPNNPEPQPHEARPGEMQQYEEPLTMYPEQS
jgi:hypothetical protein